jgi:hypothetical protein
LASLTVWFGSWYFLLFPIYFCLFFFLSPLSLSLSLSLCVSLFHPHDWIASLDLFQSTLHLLCDALPQVFTSDMKVQIAQQYIKICTLISCPYAAGDFSASSSLTVPGDTKPGNYIAQVRFFRDTLSEVTFSCFVFSEH